MLILSHIIIALVGIFASTMSVFSPSVRKIKISGIFVLLTIATGLVLVFVTNSHLLQTCVSGLAYLCVTGTLLIFAKYRLRFKPGADEL